MAKTIDVKINLNVGDFVLDRNYAMLLVDGILSDGTVICVDNDGKNHFRIANELEFYERPLKGGPNWTNTIG